MANEDRMAQIYHDYHSKVLAYMNGKLNNPTVAEDLCANVFLKIVEKIDTFDETKASISTWIFTISRNTLTDFFRTNREFAEIPEDFSETSDLEENYCRTELLDALATGLAALPARERDLIILHYYSHVKLKDIAERFGISYAYVKILHAKALNSLKKYI